MLLIGLLDSDGCYVINCIMTRYSRVYSRYWKFSDGRELKYAEDYVTP